MTEDGTNTQMGLSLINPMQQGFKTMVNVFIALNSMCYEACPRFDLRLKSLTGAIAAVSRAF